MHSETEDETDSGSYENKMEFLGCGHKTFGSKLCSSCLTNKNLYETEDMNYKNMVTSPCESRGSGIEMKIEDSVPCFVKGNNV
ncbi:11436_t:CDS:2, partial [Dentiscutata erythropus]